MIFLPSCSILVSSDLEPGTTVLPVKPEEEIPRFVRNSTIVVNSVREHAPYYASGSFAHAHLTHLTELQSKALYTPILHRCSLEELKGVISKDDFQETW